MNMVKKGLLAFTVAVSVILAVKAAPPVTSSTVTPGVWCTDFEAALAYAEKNNLPVLAFWGESGCGYCKTLMNQGIDTDKFREWQRKRTPVMIWYHGANKTTPYKNWIKNPASGEWPYVKIYWKKPDGSKVEIYFAGRDGKMPVKGGDTSTAAAVSKWITLATPGQIGGGKPNLNEQLIASFEKYCSSWTMQEAYSGGYFSVTNLPNSRLEAVAGKTSFVNIPLYRTEKAAVVNKLKIGTNALVDVSWAANETSKVYKYTLPSAVNAGDVIQLKLFAADGKALKSTSAINVVSEPANSVLNPKWIGESFSAGEWTMDLAKAIEKSKNTGSYTLALSSGALWCPYCKSLEANVLNNAKFKNWAKEKNVNLVILDNPKRSADDKRSDGVVTGVGTKPNGAPPTLLRYAQSADGISGAAYLSRKMITVGSSSATNTAEWVLQRNHNLLYKGGDLCAPEDMRTGYPTLILVKSNGKAAGRMLDGCDGNGKWSVSVDETIARLNELLLLKDGDESSSKPSTTKLTMAVEESANGSLQVNANTVFYRLANVPAGKVTFSSTDKALTLTVYEATSTLSSANKLASGTGEVTVDFVSAAGKFLAVSHYADGLKAYGTNTSRSFTVSSAVTLVPKEKKGEFKTNSGNMKMEIVSGTKYRLNGFKSYSAFEKNGDDYTAKSSGVVDMQANPGAIVSYQVWNPGVVSFMSTSERKMEADGACTIKVSRSGGASGVAAVAIAVDAGSNGSKRVTVSPSTLTWQDGDATERTVKCTIKANSTFDPTEIFVVSMSAKSDSVAAVRTGRFELTVSDTDNPVLPTASYVYRFYKGISVDESYDIQNIKENGRVTVVREGDRIPTGLKMKYDSKTKKLRFSGKPSRATASAEFSVRIREKRADGAAVGEKTTFKVEVVDPKALKPGDKGYNSVLASGGSRTSVLPLYASVEDVKVLAGTVEIKISATGRLSVKYIGTGSSKVSFSGDIGQLSDDGLISASLVKKETQLELSINNGGKAVVKISGVNNVFSKNGVITGEGGFTSATSGKYEGYYTVTLPVDETSLVPAGEVYSTGTAYLTLDVAGSGKVRVKCMMPNGKSKSITAYLQPDALTIDGVKWAVVPVLKGDSKNTVGVVLRIRENAKSTYETDPQVVMLADGSKGYWMFEDTLTTMDAYGSYYDSGIDLLGCCTDTYGTSEFALDIACDWLKASEKRGAITGVPAASVTVSANGALTVENTNEKLRATFKLKNRTGLVAGSIPVMFADGSTVKASFSGVLLPGWFDCGCSDSSVPVINRPFVSGTAVFSDSVSGKAVKRGFAVNLVPVE